MLPFLPHAHPHTPTAAFVAVLAWLTVALIMDVMTRRIPNAVWPAAWITTTPIIIGADPLQWLTLTLPWGIGISLAALLLWKLQSIGGADAKGIMWLALTLTPSSLGPGHPIHALAISIPISLGMAMLWKRLGISGPFPMFLSLSPITALIWWAILQL